MHRETKPDFDLQVSAVQAVGDSVRVALFSRDLRILFDKLYTFPKNSRALAAAYLARIPDHSGYYLFLRHPVAFGSKSSDGIAIVRLDNSGTIKWANTYAAGLPDLQVEPHETSDGCFLITVPQQTAKSIGSTFIKIGSDGNVNWAVRTEGVTLSRGDFTFGWVPYRFVEAQLFAIGTRLSSGKLSCVIFALDYQTGRIEKQVACNFSGAIGFFEKTNDSLYVTLLDQIMLGRFKCQAALLRFDFDLNLRAAKSVRNAEPRWPILRALNRAKLLFSYSYADRKTVVVETTDENFESGNACGVLQKANYSVTKSNFTVRPVDIASSPLTSITVSDANSKTSEANLSLVPLDLKPVPCDNQP